MEQKGARATSRPSVSAGHLIYYLRSDPRGVVPRQMALTARAAVIRTARTVHTVRATSAAAEAFVYTYNIIL